MGRKPVDLTGQRFGRLLVVEQAGSLCCGSIEWRCKCDCGHEVIVSSRNLRSGNTQSCGCLRTLLLKQRQRKYLDLTGQRFGRLVVIERATVNGETTWKCMCDCGRETIVAQSSLRSGVTQSCGCLMRELSSKRATKHGGRKTRLYRIWDNMKSRCNNPKKDCYRDYGGRGIKVCEEWLHDFAAFRDWALANGYDDALTIDRIDNDKGYSPDNCRWITQAEQNRNQRTNHMVTYRGETKTIREWARLYNLAPGTLSNRIQRGWDVEKALTAPTVKRTKTE